MTTKYAAEPTRVWLGRLALALVGGLAVGLLAYLAARGIAGALLLGQQQTLLSDMSGVLGNLDGPPSVNLRAARKAIQALEAQYAQISALVGLVVGTIGSIVIYVRLERRVKIAENR